MKVRGPIEVGPISSPYRYIVTCSPRAMPPSDPLNRTERSIRQCVPKVTERGKSIRAIRDSNLPLVLISTSVSLSAERSVRSPVTCGAAFLSRGKVILQSKGGDHGGTHQPRRRRRAGPLY